ncbi:MAG: nucleotide exchange factor GrpE [Nannocystaceae bacterium]|nr:nucleotide exchange factor GrpE [Nannocystaceae bacterium]
MTQGNDENSPGEDALTAEIDKTMAEAEAAVKEMDVDDEAIVIDGDIDADAEPRVDADAAELTELRERVETLREQLGGTKDKWMRALADLENYKKRTKKEMDDAALRTAKNLLPAFLPVLDNLERALEVAEPTAANASDENAENVRNLVEGIKMVRQEFLAALVRNGIEPIDSIGTVFDPAVHDALQQFDSPDFPPGVVIREYERGYMLKGRLLRPARVIVAGAGSTGVSAEDDTQAESAED